ncbi:hypothetical protein AB0N14_02065 [Streptomyces sp. NPDC051104]
MTSRARRKAVIGAVLLPLAVPVDGVPTQTSGRHSTSAAGTRSLGIEV